MADRRIPKRNPSHRKSPREFLGERIDSKKDPHVFFFRTLDVPKKSSLGLFFPKSGRLFLGTFQTLLSSAQLPVQLHRFSHGFPWEGGHVSEQWGLDSMFAFKGPYLTR